LLHNAKLSYLEVSFSFYI